MTIWFGGTYAESYNTAWLLDISTWAWSELALDFPRESDKKRMLPRYGVAYCRVGHRLYSWGGRSGHADHEQYFDELWSMDLSMNSRFKTTTVQLHRVSGETPYPPGRVRRTLFDHY